jgi:AhpD family alkylhydroperoxidase
MATLPYGDLNHPDARDLVEKIIAQRGSVLHLYQMLLHSPPIAEGWLALLTAVRQKALLPGGLRELVIMRVAILNGAPYEAQQHAPIALAEGVTSDQLDELGKWSTSDAYDPAQRAALSLTDSITRSVKPGPGEIESVRQYLDDREVVELVATISAYNMVSRFIEALGIDSNDVR